MSKRSIVLVAFTIAAVATLTVGSAAPAKSGSAAAGTVVMVHDQEPGIINPFLSTGNGYVNSLTIGPVLASGAIYNQKAQLVPYLMESVPKLVKKEPLTVTATQEGGGVERRQADHGERLRRHLSDDHEPQLGHHVA
jgi:ABC-type transport system substrate-binding protein